MRKWIKVEYGEVYKRLGYYSAWSELSNPLKIIFAMMSYSGNTKGWFKRFIKNILYSRISYIKIQK